MYEIRVHFYNILEKYQYKETGNRVLPCIMFRMGGWVIVMNVLNLNKMINHHCIREMNLNEDGLSGNSLSIFQVMYFDNTIR